MFLRQKGVWTALFGVLIAPCLADEIVATAPLLTLASYNIHVGVPMGQEIGQYKVSTDDLDKISETIQQTKAQIVALQEVDCEYGLSYPQRRRSSLLNEARYLAASSKLNYVFGSTQDESGYPTDNPRYLEWGTADQWINNGGPHGEVGNALLSQLPIVGRPENIPLPKDAGQERRACIRTVVDLGSILRSNATEAAGDQATASTSGTAVIYATHLQHNDGGTRYRQMQAILDRAKMEEPGQLVFIMGDLNHELDTAEEENPIRLAIQNGFHDLGAADTAAGADGNPLKTFPSDKPEIRIDFIFCNQALKVLKGGRVESHASDHLPVWVQVRLDSGNR